MYHRYQFVQFFFFFNQCLTTACNHTPPFFLFTLSCAVNIDTFPIIILISYHLVRENPRLRYVVYGFPSELCDLTLFCVPYLLFLFITYHCLSIIQCNGVLFNRMSSCSISFLGHMSIQG